jgi:hypothetical protein
MIGGLKTYLPRLAEIVGSTPASLYERQRALTRLGLLTAQPGRGPGSGIKLSADSVAVMVISLLATENLSDVDGRLVRLCNARVLPGDEAAKRFRAEFAERFRARLRKEDDQASVGAAGTCAVTGAKTFRQAIKTVFADPSFSREGAIGILVEQYRGAAIDFSESGGERRSTYFEAAWRSGPILIIRQAVAFSHLTRLIADDLSERLSSST